MNIETIFRIIVQGEKDRNKGHADKYHSDPEQSTSIL